ncbi:unnamed protein product, partial [Laminaria digitata]
SGGGSGSGGSGRPVVRSRGFRDLEGEAIQVAAKMSEIIRRKDLVEGLKVLRVVQVAPFLGELGSYTVLGPALRKRKVDVDHIIASTERMTVGKLMDQALDQLEMVGFTGSQQLKRLQMKASRDIGRLKAKAGFGSTSRPISLDLTEAALTAGAPGAIEDARQLAVMAADHARAFTDALTPEDVAAISKVLNVFRDMCKRRSATVRARVAKTSKIAAAAVAADVVTSANVAGAGTAAAAAALEQRQMLLGEAMVAAAKTTARGAVNEHGNESALDGEDGDEEGEEKGPWRLDQEIELLSKDAAAAESFQHVMSRLAEVAKAGGVYVDAYLVLSLMELAFGNLLQRLPSLLPVVQTTIQKKGFVIKVSNLNLAGIKFPRSGIHLAFRGTSLPPRGSIVETNTCFGRGRVVRYKKRTRSLCVELLSWPLRSGSHKFARAFIPPGAAVVVDPDEERAAKTANRGSNRPSSSGTGSPTPSSVPSSPTGGADQQRSPVRPLTATKAMLAASLKKRGRDLRATGEKSR